MPQQPVARPQQDPNLDSEGKPLPGTTVPCAPIEEQKQELGCYVAARVKLGMLPAGTLSWHLDTFRDRAAAEAAKGPHAAVTGAFDRTWLFTIAAPDWRPSGAVEHVATVGPLPLEPRAAEYSVMYLASTFRPGNASFAHDHPGPEAWFVLSGEQCVETPEGRTVGHAGDTLVVRGDLPMVSVAIGTELRRVLTLVLHDASKPATTRVDTWKPKGLCR